jgi:hypothetical protein
MKGQREPFRLGGTRIAVRLGSAEADPLRIYARRHSLPLSEAARRLIRTSLRNSGSTLIEEDETDRGGALLEEFALLNLIVSEQTLKLLETITPQGPGAADSLLGAATQSAQHRLAGGLRTESPGKGNGH